ncbi:rhodanese domain-containing protein CG4456-like [Cylas formicarius]|uniref:rhodanese domain-containing protein CG4456-like n=1 Tax=Cylas formicarius TaxID=197179 RepID=UPI0029583282|nr:rhodanese domain-containing protein CG4456-like [Cylas formicarius]
MFARTVLISFHRTNAAFVRHSYKQIHLDRFNKPNKLLGISCFPRNASQVVHCLPKIEYEDVKKCYEDKNVLLVDVREPNELNETGVLPNSINIPLGDVENIFRSMSNEDFKKNFGRDKPNLDTMIVFSCMKGIRSEKAQIIANQLGFKNVKNYIGGWMDWVERTKATMQQP